MNDKEFQFIREQRHAAVLQQEWEMPLEKLRQLILSTGADIDESKLHISFTKNLQFGDIQTNIPRVFKPNEVYQNLEFLIYCLDYMTPGIYKVENGMMNLYLDKSIFINTIRRINAI